MTEDDFYAVGRFSSLSITDHGIDMENGTRHSFR